MKRVRRAAVKTLTSRESSQGLLAKAVKVGRISRFPAREFVDAAEELMNRYHRRIVHRSGQQSEKQWHSSLQHSPINRPTSTNTIGRARLVAAVSVGDPAAAQRAVRGWSGVMDSSL